MKTGTKILALSAMILVGSSFFAKSYADGMKMEDMKMMMSDCMKNKKGPECKKEVMMKCTDSKMSKKDCHKMMDHAKKEMKKNK